MSDGMTEITRLCRYEIRGSLVWDRTERRPVSLEELRAAMEMLAMMKWLAGEARREGILDE